MSCKFLYLEKDVTKAIPGYQTFSIFGFYTRPILRFNAMPTGSTARLNLIMVHRDFDIIRFVFNSLGKYDRDNSYAQKIYDREATEYYVVEPAEDNSYVDIRFISQYSIYYMFGVAYNYMQVTRLSTPSE